MKLRVSWVLALVAMLLGLVAVPATAADAQPVAYPPTICPTLSISTTTPLPGSSMTVSGTNFTPNATIKLELHSPTYVLATVKSSAQGTFTTSVKLPAGVTGNHEITAVGGGATATCPVDPVQILKITPPVGPGGGTSGNGGGTAFTGVDVLLLVLVAAALLASGVAINRGAKRRKQAEWYAQ